MTGWKPIPRSMPRQAGCLSDGFQDWLAGLRPSLRAESCRRPSPVFGALHQASVHWVAFDVLDDAVHLGIVPSPMIERLRLPVIPRLAANSIAHRGGEALDAVRDDFARCS